MNRAPEIVVGTAGHIDHGKTSLIRTLTGIDTDRLAEEKRRGISIDLGFAHLPLPSGEIVSFIDVPGHERFIKNMLAGVGGIQAVMLIVAANESVMPQTREHFEICRMLDIQYGFVVLTKADLASPEQMRIAYAEVSRLVANSFLANSPLIRVSSITGEGISEVIHQLSRLSRSFVVSQANREARLAVDRSFSLKGFGTVATGTLSGGLLQIGDSLLVHPLRKQVRIRGLQVHGKPVNQAYSDQRTAVNLANIDHTELQRGFVLTKSEKLQSTQILDGALEWLDTTKLPTRHQQVLLHIGTLETVADLKMFRSDKEGRNILARLRLTEPAVALPGDRFILRCPSPSRTMAGGVVIDPFPSVRLNRKKTVERLVALSQASDSERIHILVSDSQVGQTLSQLIRLTGQPAAAILKLVEANPELFLHVVTQSVFSKKWLEERRSHLLSWLKDFHSKNPMVAGATLSAARLGLAPDLARAVIDDFPALRVAGETISLATHKASFNEQEAIALQTIEHAFRQAAYQPPPASEVIRAAVPDQKKARLLLESLVKNKRLVKVSDDLIFHFDVIMHLQKSLSVHKGKSFSVPDFKGWTQMSRKYAIPVLEYLDREKITRRVGDQRIIV